MKAIENMSEGQVILMVIIEDKGQQDKKHELKHISWEAHGVYWERYPLPVGDYILGSPPVLDVIARKQKRGVDVKKMDFLGTYSVCVDTKRDMQEIVGNICGKQHERFRDECILAQNNGIRLIVLVENTDGIQTLADVPDWRNPRAKIMRWTTLPDGRKKRVQAYPDATQGATLFKAMSTMQDKYGVKFLFCRPEDAADKVVQILADSS